MCVCACVYSLHIGNRYKSAQARKRERAHADDLLLMSKFVPPRKCHKQMCERELNYKARVCGAVPESASARGHARAVGPLIQHTIINRCSVHACVRLAAGGDGGNGGVRTACGERCN